MRIFACAERICEICFPKCINCASFCFKENALIEKIPCLVVACVTDVMESISLKTNIVLRQLENFSKAYISHKQSCTCVDVLKFSNHSDRLHNRWSMSVRACLQWSKGKNSDSKTGWKPNPRANSNAVSNTLFQDWNPIFSMCPHHFYPTSFCEWHHFFHLESHELIS